MSVYIKGMEMPKNCDCCDFMTVEGEYGEPSCPFGLIIKCASEKHPDCPLVPVPPHGDLIDLNEAAEAVCCYDGEAWLDTKQIHIVIPADKEGEG